MLSYSPILSPLVHVAMVLLFISGIERDINCDFLWF